MGSTSYLAANAVILPITGWSSAHLGRRNYFLISIAIFTLSSALCGMAGSLGELILFRIIQGLAGGGLQPSSQAVLLDAFPREKQAVAMTLFGLAALLAPVAGPTLGGWLTDQYEWRRVFLINVPIGLFAFAGCYALLRDPDYLTKERAELKKRPFHFDSIGLSLLIVVMVSWEVMLSKGQEWDWLGDPSWRVQTLAILCATGLIALIFWELRSPNPVVNFRPLRERNFVACCIIIFIAYAVLYGASTSLPGLLQSLFGYNALAAGLVMSPAGFFAVLAMPIVSRLLGRKDRRAMADRRGIAADRRQQLLDVADEPRNQSGPSHLASGRLGRGTGGRFCARKCGRLSLHASLVTWRGSGPVEPSAQRRRQRWDIDGPNPPRTAGSIPYAAAGRVPGNPLNPAVHSFLEQAQARFLQQTGDPAAAQQLAWQALENLRHQQASALAYFDCFWLFAVVILAVTVAVFLMKRSVAEKGTPIGGE